MDHKCTQFPNFAEKERALGRLGEEILQDFMPARLTQPEDNGHWSALYITCSGSCLWEDSSRNCSLSYSTQKAAGCING